MWGPFIRAAAKVGVFSAKDREARTAAENEYRAAMLLPHERSIPHVETPSLVCHLGYRLTEAEDPLAQSTREAFTTKRDQRVVRTNRFLTAIAAHNNATASRFARFPPAEDLSDRSKHQQSAYSTDEFGEVDPQGAICLHVCDYCCFKISLNVVLHTEFTTFMFVAHPKKLKGELTPETCEPHCIAALEAFYEIEAGDTGKEFNSDALYQNFWTPFFAHLQRILHDRFSLSEFGLKFAEFQGAIMRTPGGVRANELYDTDAQIKLARADLPPLGGPDTPLLNEKEIESVNEDRRLLGLRWLHTHHRGIRRLMGFHEPPNPALRFMPGHAVICEMFDGIALYGSTLHPPHKGKTRDDLSVRFFVMYSGAARHELARLLQNLLRCGELRAAALFDLADIRQASDAIRLLDLSITDTTRTFSKLSAKKRSKKTTESLIKWSDELATIGGMGRGGLMQRISRGTSHANTLRQRLETLGIHRISSWQSYDGFLLSNLSRHFDHIRSVGDRYTDLQRRLRQLSESSVAEDLDAQQHRLVHLQAVGEVFAVFAFAYYVGQVITHGLEVFFTTWVHDVAERVDAIPAQGALSDEEYADAKASIHHHISAMLGFAAALATAGLYYLQKLLRWLFSIGR